MPRRAVVASYCVIVSSGIGVASVTTTAPLRAQSIVRVDVANDGSESVGLASSVDVCDDATRVVFATTADGLDPADVNGLGDILLRDLVAGTTKLVSVRTSGAQGNAASSNPRISADGLFVAFDSMASNFVVGGDTNGVQDVFLRDLAAGKTTRVSVANDGGEANGWSSLAAISGDGQRVLFLSDATNLVANDQNGTRDLFLRDVAAGTTIRVNLAADGSEPDDYTLSGRMSRDGQVVVFDSWADNLVAGDTNGALDAFVKDLATGVVVRASVDSNGGELSWGVEGSSMISGDGTLVAFASFQPDLAPNDTNGVGDTFLRDLLAGTTSIVSLDSNGAVSAAEWKGSFPAGISSDGRFVLMGSDAFTLAPGEGLRSYGYDDVYVHDRSLSMTTRQSNNPRGVAGDWGSYVGSMTPDGLHVVFTSRASDLIDGDTTAVYCAFLLTRPLRSASSDDYGDGWAGTLGVPTLSIAAPPLLNQPFDLSLSNSLGGWTVALLMIGTAPAQVPTQLGGDLLVELDWSMLVAVAPAGFDLRATLPPDERLAATTLYFQAIELDPGATHGVSFTAGLEVDPGF